MTRRKRPAATTMLGSGSQKAILATLEPSTPTRAQKTGNTAPGLVALSEREFQAIVRAALEQRGFTCWVVPNMKLTTAGLPDIVAWHARLPGLLLALELKREKDGRITPKQAAALAHLETVPGVESRILRPSGWERLRDALDLMLKHSRAEGDERWDSTQPLLPRCAVCRQRLLCVVGPEVTPIGAARITRVDRQTGDVTVVCVCGEVKVWEVDRVRTISGR